MDEDNGELELWRERMIKNDVKREKNEWTGGNERRKMWEEIRS